MSKYRVLSVYVGLLANLIVAAAAANKEHLRSRLEDIAVGLHGHTILQTNTESVTQKEAKMT